jgi:hypothetical protein
MAEIAIIWSLEYRHLTFIEISFDKTSTVTKYTNTFYDVTQHHRYGCVYMDLDQNNHSRTINVKNAYLVQIRVDSRLTKIYIVVLEVNAPVNSKTEINTWHVSHLFHEHADILFSQNDKLLG